MPMSMIEIERSLKMLRLSGIRIDGWGKCLGDNAIALAILDRILHHGNLLKFEGQSYRLKETNMRLAKNTEVS